MQDDFDDGGMGLPDDEMTGGSELPDLEIGGEGETDLDAEHGRRARRPAERWCARPRICGPATKGSWFT